jgi:membrane protein DedA with SNARE-associated domain
MTATVVHLVHSLGPVAVLILMAAESCGLPVPSEVVMPLAGALAAGGHMSIVWAIVAGAVGNLVGSLVAYGLAARFGTPLLLNVGSRFGFREAHLNSTVGWFQRYGLVSVLVARVVPVLRTYISFPAGLARVPLLPFSVLTVAGSAIWSAALAVVGYLLGQAYMRAAGPIQLVGFAVAALIVVVVVVWYLRGRRRLAEAL